jgi:hypothetical protein
LNWPVQQTLDQPELAIGHCALPIVSQEKMVSINQAFISAHQWAIDNAQWAIRQIVVRG